MAKSSLAAEREGSSVVLHLDLAFVTCCSFLGNEHPSAAPVTPPTAADTLLITSLGPLAFNYSHCTRKGGIKW